jgi:hypothetical protein
MENLADKDRVVLLDLLDRVIDQGVVIVGDAVISVADVDLIYIQLRLLVASASKLLSTGQPKEHLIDPRGET